MTIEHVHLANNPLKLPARGRPGAGAWLRSRAAA